MATPWQLVVTSLDGSAPPREASVEADNWLAALRSARKQLAEDGGVPPGASCTMSAAGDVTIVDAATGRRYELRKQGARSVAPANQGSPAPAAQPPPAAPGPPASVQAKKRSNTVAYTAEEAAKMRAELMANAPVAPRPSAPAAQPAAPSAQPAAPVRPPPAAAPPKPPAAPPPESPGAPRDARKHTVAYMHNPLGAPAAPEAGAPQPGPSQPMAPKQPAPPAPAPPAPAPPAPAPRPQPTTQPKTPDPAPAPPAPRVRQRTVAYMQSPIASPPAAPEPQAPAAPPAAASPAPAAPAPPAAAPPAPPASHRPPSQPLDAGASMPTTGGPVLLHARDEEPTEERPIVYRERAFVVDPDTDDVACEWVLREQLAKVRSTLDPTRSGHFVSIALFDHHWSGRPSKPPLATLQWKDWRGEPEIKVSKAASTPAWRAPSDAPPAVSLPPGKIRHSGPPESWPKAESPRPSRPTPPPAEETGEHDRRLAYAFEASQDLYFLETAGEGVAFAVRLLRELVPCEVARGTLYDINTDELRIVGQEPAPSETAPGAVPAKRGLFSIAIASGLHVWVSVDLQSDPRFKPEVDSVPDLPPRNAAYIVLRRKDTLLGVLQLLNRTGDRGFTESDKAVATYAAEQLTNFLGERRAIHAH